MGGVYFNKLENGLKQDLKEEELDKIIDGFNLRCGPNGIDRTLVMNRMFKRILELCLPTYIKHFIYCASHDQGIFEKDPEILKMRRKNVSKYKLGEMKLMKSKE